MVSKLSPRCLADYFSIAVPKASGNCSRKKKEPVADGLLFLWQTRLAGSCPGNIHCEPAKRSGHSNCVSRGIERRGEVDVARPRAAYARPLEAPLESLRLESLERGVEDVQSSIVRDVRVAVDCERSVLRLERAVGVGSRCHYFERQVVRGRVRYTCGRSGDRDLATLGALASYGKLVVDRNR